jgi:transposase-like protein
MVVVPVTCPYCHSNQVITGGQTEPGTQRYRCPRAIVRQSRTPLASAIGSRSSGALCPCGPG